MRKVVVSRFEASGKVGLPWNWVRLPFQGLFLAIRGIREGGAPGAAGRGDEHG